MLRCLLHPVVVIAVKVAHGSGHICPPPLLLLASNLLKLLGYILTTANIAV